jgi:hypothetical protein
MSLRPISEIVDGVMADIVTRFPFEKTIEPIPNDSHMEFMFDVVTGQPPARAKRLILMARRPEVGVLDDGQADVMLDALNLRRA